MVTAVCIESGPGMKQYIEARMKGKTVDIVDEFVRQEGGSALAALAGVGFSLDQATAFMPAAVGSLLDAVTRVNLESLLASDLSTQTVTLLGLVDMEPLSTRFKLDGALGSKGVAALIPRLMGFLQENDGLSALLSLVSPLDGDLPGGNAKPFLN